VPFRPGRVPEMVSSKVSYLKMGPRLDRLGKTEKIKRVLHI
jgi:hypothetical protein